MNAATQSLLGRYRLVKVLGQGAMGVVYEAVDTRLGRTVAIKTVLRSHMNDEAVAAEYAARFEREAQAAARLSHPHVVTVYDFGEHEDISYIVMEFVRGRELNQAFEGNEKFALSESVRIMRELLQALDYAHQQGIVHRDVKPANVLLDGAGRVKLTDFGVARVANATQDRTMPGTLVGTPSYMSPEQILGLAVGSRADIFAAGVILYQFLTGKRPFSGGGPFGVQRKIVQDDAVPPSQINASLPKGFDAIVAKALAKKPEDRYESAAAFAADLEQVALQVIPSTSLLDLDLPDNPPAAAGPAAPAPAPAPASGAVPLTLITEVPFGPGGNPAEPPAGRPPTSSLTEPPPPFDPEATVIMVRPPVPNAVPMTGIYRAPKPPADAGPTPSRDGGSALPRPAAAASATYTGTQRPASPGSMPAGGSMAPQLPASPAASAAANRTMAPPPPRAAASSQALATSSAHGALDTTAPGVSRRASPPPPAPAPPPVARPPAAPVAEAPAPPALTIRMRSPLVVPPPQPLAQASFVRRTVAPLAAGVGVAALGIGLWLLVTRPLSPRVIPSTATETPAPAPVPAEPAPAPPPAAQQPAAAPPPEAAPPATATPAPAPAGAEPTATPAPAAAAEPKPIRRPPPPPAEPPRAHTPRPAPSPAPASPNTARCNDLLQRMQLGEPLTPEQTAFFQGRCTR